MKPKIKTFNIFRIEYSWYEGEHDETLLGKNVEQKKFEKDILMAKRFAESLIGKEIKNHDYLGKGYSVECLPEYYQQIIWYLTSKLGYVCSYFDEDLKYDVNDWSRDKIRIERVETKIKREDLEGNK